VPELDAEVARIDVTGLVALLDSGEGTVVIDLARSIDFREGHIPGALWGVRTRLGALKPQLAGAKHVVVTSPDGIAARLAVQEVNGLCDATVWVLEGGTDAWHAFGRPLIKDRNSPPWTSPHRQLPARLRSELRRGGGDAGLSHLGDRAGEPDQARRHGGVRCW
jgi:rhodanese-related sulfurtransferase